MGIYVNPGNSGFAEIADADYVDKTMLIELINRTVRKRNKFTCVSRPRRFGKSYAAKMLCAYYDRSCDSHELFDDKNIARSESYLTYLNHYNVIYLDITSFVSAAGRQEISFREVPNRIVDALRDELASMYPELPVEKSLTDLLIYCVEKNGGEPFIFIIDEWDALIREAKDDVTAQKRYLDLLREWFKNGNFTPKVVAAAYMTGILPIKKDGRQSAVSEFDEFTMLDPFDYAEYAGFTEKEVVDRCAEKGMDYGEIKAWYDGYDFPEVGAIYNPYSVMNALRTGKCRSYWRKTSAAESLKNYINMDFEGLQSTVARLIAGEKIPVDVDGFQNDFETFESSDDVLTLLVHLGYLTYHEEEQVVQIPNEEVRIEFRQFLTQKRMNTGWITLIKRSQKLLDDTITGNSEAVAAALKEIREEQYAPQFYNNEQALRAVIKYAYFAAFGQYVKIEEMPSGKGIADVVFIPASLSRLPAMIIELKWNKTSDGAAAQIRNRKYTASLKPFAGNILLVGINYDEKTGEHTCAIERA